MLLQTFLIKCEVSDDTWNKHPMGDVSCTVHAADGSLVGDFNYRMKTGQVGGIYLTKKYRCQTLEQQMLIYMMTDMQAAGAKQIWEAAPNEAMSGQRFYSALWSFAYKDSRVHPSVTGTGYIMNIPADIRRLPIVPGVGIYD